MDLISLILLLIVDTSFSWLRMFIALFFSIIIGIFVGIYAATSETAAKVILPVVDVLQTLPILAFFPFVIFVVVSVLPGYIGINAAVIVLIITSMLWNIIFGVYEAIKTLPKEMLEIADLYKFSFTDKLRKIFIPASIPRIIEQSRLSWAIGLFYLVTSEIFSIGNAQYQVEYGIGVALVQLGSLNIFYYLIGIGVFLVFLLATIFFFFAPLERRFNRDEKPTDANVLGYRRAAALVSLIRRISYVERAKSIVVKGGTRIGKEGAVLVRNIRPVTVAKRDKRTYNTGIISAAIAVVIIAALLYYAFALGLFQYEGEILVALAASFARIWLAYLAILAVAIPLCVYLIFMSGNKAKHISLFQVLASIPATILMPIIVIGLKGVPYGPNVVAFVIFFLSGIWYVIFSVMSNAGSLKNLMEVKEVYGVRGKRAWKKIYLWAIMPGIITGSITGIAAEWNASIVAEYFTTSGISGTGSTVITSVGVGLGKLFDISLNSNNIGLLLLGMANMVVMIYIINVFVWKRLYRKISEFYK